MRARNAGRIVNLASIACKEGNANMTGYSAAKGAVIALTKALGKELANTGIRGERHRAGRDRDRFGQADDRSHPQDGGG